MSHLTSYIPIICKWPSLKAFGVDIGITGAYARTLKMRDTLPSRYWAPAERAAEKRGFEGVSVQVLAEISAARKALELKRHGSLKKQLMRESFVTKR
jgi:hypothetical protein